MAHFLSALVENIGSRQDYESFMKQYEKAEYTLRDLSFPKLIDLRLVSETRIRNSVLRLKKVIVRTGNTALFMGIRVVKYPKFYKDPVFYR